VGQDQQPGRFMDQRVNPCDGLEALEIGAAGRQVCIVLNPEGNGEVYL